MIERQETTPDTFNGEATFALRNRAFRLLWQLTWLFLAAWTPPNLNRWRISIANLFGARIHKGASLYGSVRIWYPANLTMAARSTLGPKVNCYCVAPITLGEYAVVSQGAHLCAATHEIHEAAFQLKALPIRIGAHAWVCAEAFVGPGVEIGEGAVLAARAVAFHDLEPWTVYRGNPAERKGPRTRFERP